MAAAKQVWDRMDSSLGSLASVLGCQYSNALGLISMMGEKGTRIQLREEEEILERTAVTHESSTSPTN